MPEETPTTPAPNYHYPPMEERKVIGKRLSRIDGMAKSTGAARYHSDLKPKDLLFAALVTSPYAHARVKRIDFARALAAPGVRAAVGPGEVKGNTLTATPRRKTSGTPWRRFPTSRSVRS